MRKTRVREPRLPVAQRLAERAHSRFAVARGRAGSRRPDGRACGCVGGLP